MRGRPTTSVSSARRVLRRRAGRVAGTVVATAVIAGLLSAPATAAGSTTTLTPTADSYVNANAKTTNYGTSGSLSSSGTPDVESFMRFALPVAPSGQSLSAATLRIKTTTLASAGSADSQSVRFADNGWTETAVNYNSRPA